MPAGKAGFLQFPPAGQQCTSPAPLSTGAVLLVLLSGRIYLPCSEKGTKGGKNLKKSSNLTEGGCMAGKEKHCSFNPKPVLQSIIFNSRHHTDSPSQGERAVGSPSLPPLTFPWLGGGMVVMSLAESMGEHPSMEGEEQQ